MFIYKYDDILILSEFVHKNHISKKKNLYVFII